MLSLRLSDYVEGYAWKYLSAVDCEPTRSHQHEIGGLVKAGFRKFLGDPVKETVRFNTNFVYADEENNESILHQSYVSWYDARRNVPSRSQELRLYYDDNPVTLKMR